jgi:uncharacterized protein
MHIDMRSLPPGRSIIEQKVALSAEQIRDCGITGEAACRAVVDALQYQIHASVTFSCVVNTQCSRCLKPISLPVSGQYSMILKDRNAPRQTDEDGTEADFYYTDSDKIIDTRQALYEEIIIAIPIMPLCRSSCESVLPEKSSTTVRVFKPVDPRWKALEKLKKPGKIQEEQWLSPKDDYRVRAGTKGAHIVQLGP